MSITFTRLDPTGDDHEAIVDFMTSNRFPFHVRSQPARGDVETAIAEGCYRDEDNDSCWIEHSELGRIGFLRLEDLSEGASLFDLRLNGPYPGRGLGDQVDRPDQR